MDNVALFIAGILASGLGVALVQGIKKLVLTSTGKELQGKPALWVTVGVAGVLALLAVILAGAFTAPAPTTATEWATRLTAGTAIFFSCMTLIYKNLPQPKIDAA